MNFAAYLARQVTPLWQPGERIRDRRVKSATTPTAHTAETDERIKRAFAQHAGPVSASDIDRQLGRDRKGISTRLKTLASRGVVKKVDSVWIRGGRAYLFEWIGQ